jgi:hypothetical protein
MIGTHIDRLRAPSGRSEGAGDVGHRQAFTTPSEGARRRPRRRLAEVFGWRRARLTIPRIAASHAPTRSRQRRACRATPARRLYGSLSSQGGISSADRACTLRTAAVCAEGGVDRNGHSHTRPKAPIRARDETSTPRFTQRMIAVTLGWHPILPCKSCLIITMTGKITLASQNLPFLPAGRGPRHPGAEPLISIGFLGPSTGAPLTSDDANCGFERG